MKKTLSILFFFLMTSIAKAFYVPTALYCLALKADKIVCGEIISLDSTTFTIKIEISLTGEKGLLKIEKFNDWTCASRWTEYQIGQKMFLFLGKYEDRIWAIGGGNEGELPVLGDSVFINAFSLPPSPPKGIGKEELDKWRHKEYFESKFYEIYGGAFYGYRVSLLDLIKTVNAIRECFRIDPDFQCIEIKNAEIICEKDKVDEHMSSDSLFKWTYNQLVK